MKKDKIYLDNCCYNRPYDDQSEPRVYLEAHAKLAVQDMVRKHEVNLVGSQVLDFEIAKSPYKERAETISNFINKHAKERVDIAPNSPVRDIVKKITATGIKIYDAYHIACAIYAGCDFFLTTDKRLLRYDTDEIEIINPINYITRKDEI